MKLWSPEGSAQTVFPVIWCEGGIRTDNPNYAWPLFSVPGSRIVAKDLSYLVETVDGKEQYFVFAPNEMSREDAETEFASLLALGLEQARS